MRPQDILETPLGFAQELPYYPQDAYEERTHRFIARGAALAVLCVNVHLASLLGPWLWMDESLILANLQLRSWGGLLTALIHPLSTPATGPATILYFLLWRLGSSPLPFHLLSLAVHTLNVILFWVVLRRLGVVGAWLAAAVFAVHPVEVQSVAWASELSSLLCGTFCLLATDAYLRLRQIAPPPPLDYFPPPVHPRRWEIWCGVYWALALVSGPAACLLPAVWALLDWWKRQTLRNRERQQLLVLQGVGLLCLGFRAGLAEWRHLAGAAGALLPQDRLAMWGSGCALALFREVIPFPMLFVEPRWTVHGDAWRLLFFLGLVVALGLLWLGRSRLRPALLALAIFVLFMIPQPPLLRHEWLRYTFVGEQFQYLAGLPVFALIAGCFDTLAGLATQRPGRWLRLLGGIVILAPLCLLTWVDGRRYGSEMALLNHVLAYDPQSLAGRARLAVLELNFSNLPQAADYLTPIERRIDRLVQYRGADAGAAEFPLMVRGSILEAQRRYSQAADVYSRVLKIEPLNQEALLRRAAVYSLRGERSRSLDEYFEVLAQHPNDEQALNNLGLALMQDGRLDDAVEDFQKALRVDPNFIAAHINLANAFFAQRRLQEASDELQAVVKIDPRNFEAFLNAGVMLAQLRDFPKSERMLKAAVAIKPNSPDAHNNLGIVLAAQRFYSEAIDHFEKAVKLRPGFTDAQQNLDKARAQRDKEPFKQ